MTTPLFTAGSRILAATLDQIAPLSAVKTSDESVTSSTALQNDNQLYVPLAANAYYAFECYLDYEGGTLGSSDIQWGWSFPAGLTMRYQVVGGNITGATTYIGTSVVVGSTNGAGTLRAQVMKGSVFVGSTAGTLQLQWAQNTSSGTATIVHAQSYIAMWLI